LIRPCDPVAGANGPVEGDHTIAMTLRRPARALAAAMLFVSMAASPSLAFTAEALQMCLPSVCFRKPREDGNTGIARGPSRIDITGPADFDLARKKLRTC